MDRAGWEEVEALGGAGAGQGCGCLAPPACAHPAPEKTVSHVAFVFIRKARLVSVPNPEQTGQPRGVPRLSLHLLPSSGRGGQMGRCRAGPEHPQQGHTAGHAPQRPSGAPEGPPGPRLLPKAVLLRWLQEGTRRLLLTPRPWPLAEGGRVRGRWPRLGGASEVPSGFWGAPGFPAEGRRRPLSSSWPWECRTSSCWSTTAGAGPRWTGGS